MGKIFEFNARTVSLIDLVSGIKAEIVSTSGKFVRTDKGLMWKNSGAGYLRWALPFSLNQDWTAHVEVKTVPAEFNDLWRPYFGITNTGQYQDGYNITPGRVIGFDGGVVAASYSDGFIGDPFHHTITLVHKLSEKKLYTYIDGIANITDTYSGTLMTDPSYMMIGYGSGSYYSSSFVGRALVYDHFLTSEEGAKLYKEFLDASPITKTVR